jgi:hypothetical protein
MLSLSKHDIKMLVNVVTQSQAQGDNSDDGNEGEYLWMTFPQRSQ